MTSLYTTSNGKLHVRMGGNLSHLGLLLNSKFYLQKHFMATVSTYPYLN